jgi:hypothetical protein
MRTLKENIDYYINEEGLFVFMEAYHLKRGFCCNSGCKHCPYELEKITKQEVKDEKTVDFSE